MADTRWSWDSNLRWELQNSRVCAAGQYLQGWPSPPSSSSLSGCSVPSQPAASSLMSTPLSPTLESAMNTSLLGHLLFASPCPTFLSQVFQIRDSSKSMARGTCKWPGGHTSPGTTTPICLFLCKQIGFMGAGWTSELLPRIVLESAPLTWLFCRSLVYHHLGPGLSQSPLNWMVILQPYLFLSPFFTQSHMFL